MNGVPAYPGTPQVTRKLMTAARFPHSGERCKGHVLGPVLLWRAHNLASSNWNKAQTRDQDLRGGRGVEPLSAIKWVHTIAALPLELPLRALGPHGTCGTRDPSIFPPEGKLSCPLTAPTEERAIRPVTRPRSTERKGDASVLSTRRLAKATRSRAPTPGPGDPVGVARQRQFPARKYNHPGGQGRN